MNATKKINVNFSSLVGLKAELLRKQAEVNEAKLKTESAQMIPKVKKKIKRPKSESKKDKADEMSEIDVNAHKKSKLMLEAKARLYDRLKKSKNNNDNFLVDFKNKSDESEEEHHSDESETHDTIMENEDDWVEYVDCFGRTRKCLYEDLPIMQEKDKLVEQQVMKRKNDVSRDNDEVEAPVVEKKEPEIEIMRRKWEEQTQKLAEKGNIHYQDILFDEARAHGVGYYAFSQDEEERIKQQENLVKLRMDTEKKQKEMRDLRELRDKMEQNRLKAAKIRQRIRAGLPAEPTEEELAQEKEIAQDSSSRKSPEVDKANHVALNSEESNKQEEQQDSTTNKSEESIVNREDKIKALGELLDKRPTWRKMSQEEWVEKYRNIRFGEFAPVYGNFKHGGYLVPEDRDVEVTENESRQRLSSVDASDERLNYSDYSNEIVMPQTSNIISNNEQPAENANQSSPDSGGPICESRNAEDNNKNPLSNNLIQYPIKKSINEENIMAGLKYLREKFEERQNT